jgi:hypothetical protein
MNTQPDTALKTLQLLLQCGMVCREELNVVLEMLPKEKAATSQHPAASNEQPRQNALILEFDSGV